MGLRSDSACARLGYGLSLSAFFVGTLLGCTGSGKQARFNPPLLGKDQPGQGLGPPTQTAHETATARSQSPGAVAQASSPAAAAELPPAPSPVAPPTGRDVDPRVATGIVLPEEKSAPAPIAPKTEAEPDSGVQPVSSRMSEPDYQVRIVALIGTTPIYEREVREAVYQRIPEFINLPSHERKAKEQALFKEELRRTIERELVLDELFSMLNSKKQQAAVGQLKEAAGKEADFYVRELRKRAGLHSDADFKLFLRSQGLTLSGLRRQVERSFMMKAFIGERLKPKVQGISLADIKDYYNDHPDEFKREDQVKWQDLFIRADYFPTREAAHKYVKVIYTHAQRGEDFLKLIKTYDHGTSKDGDGIGFGETRGKINPAELEPTLFNLKQGEVGLVEFEHGYHIVRVVERVYAGLRPFDEKVQAEIRQKLTIIIQQQEVRQIVDGLWRRYQPQILVD